MPPKRSWKELTVEERAFARGAAAVASELGKKYGPAKIAELIRVEYRAEDGRPAPDRSTVYRALNSQSFQTQRTGRPRKTTEAEDEQLITAMTDLQLVEPGEVTARVVLHNLQDL
jgi:hypothetical protein